MAQSTGIVLATGAITLVNTVILEPEQTGTAGGDPWNNAARVIVATGLFAAGLSALERPAPELAVALGWAAFLAMMIRRLDPKVPSPTERIVKWWDTARK